MAIRSCAGELGADSYRKRRDATRRLIAIGRLACPVSEMAATPYRAEAPYRKWVTDEMNSLLSHTDPEVKGRAKQVIEALPSKQTIVRQRFRRDDWRHEYR